LEQNQVSKHHTLCKIDCQYWNTVDTTRTCYDHEANRPHVGMHATHSRYITVATNCCFWQ